MRIIAVMSPKGGIGKTTTSDAIAYMLGEEQEKRVLILDGDPQGDTSKTFEAYEPEGTGMSELLERHVSVGGSYRTTDLIRPTQYSHIDMAASIASVIMFACDELHFATGAQAMIHKPLCMAWGNADDFKEVIKQLDLCEDSILDVYEEHLKEGVTRDKIKSFMAKEKWFSGAELAEYFDVLIDEKAAVAACASDYFEKYNHVPESIKGTATKDIVDAVLAELENRNNAAAEAEKQRIEAEKQDILADLDMYGI